MCHPVPPPRGGRGTLEHDCLRALGKRHDAKGWPKSRDAAAALLPTWLRAERIETVVLLDYKLFPVDAVEAFTSAVHAGGATVERIEREHPIGASSGYPGDIDVPVPPAAPLASWTPCPWLERFFAACELQKRSFSEVDEVMAAACRAVDSWLSRHKSVTTRDLGWFLAGICDAGCQTDRRARQGGAHVALLRHGLYVQADRMAWDAASEPAQTLPVKQIRAVSDPTTAAVVALAQAGIEGATVAVLQLGNVVTTTQGTRVAGYLFQDATAAALRAQVQARLAQGSGPTDPLFRSTRVQTYQAANVEPRRELPLAATNVPVNDGADEWSFVRLTGEPETADPLLARTAQLVRRLTRTPRTSLRNWRTDSLTAVAAHRLIELQATAHPYPNRPFRDEELCSTKRLRFSQFLERDPGDLYYDDLYYDSQFSSR